MLCGGHGEHEEFPQIEIDPELIPEIHLDPPAACTACDSSAGIRTSVH